ncbi:DeoR family transcriptional regulator [Actinoplanes sp. CA-142083]|uniref:DeoR family transcriptional regulator n=1 Tax=Actinoplanes sp. CA-142083 TaxID=3239903 RepID=UPI003D93E552
MLAAIRRRRILDLLARHEYVTVGEACTATGASMATTQRDLAHLATAGALTRIRGGATRPATARDEESNLVACLTRAGRAAGIQDLATVETELRQALDACRRLRDHPASAPVSPRR